MFIPSRVTNYLQITFQLLVFSPACKAGTCSPSWSSRPPPPPTLASPVAGEADDSCFTHEEVKVAGSTLALPLHYLVLHVYYLILTAALNMDILVPVLKALTEPELPCP